MPVTWRLSEGILYLNLVGIHNLDDLRATVNAAIADPGFTPGTTVLIDIRSSLAYTRSAATLEATISFYTSLPALGLGSRIATVCTRADQRKNIVERIAEGAHRAGMDLRIFATANNAADWLRSESAEKGKGHHA